MRRLRHLSVVLLSYTRHWGLPILDRRTVDRGWDRAIETGIGDLSQCCSVQVRGKDDRGTISTVQLSGLKPGQSILYRRLTGLH